jgi:hypothetical protein
MSEREKELSMSDKTKTPGTDLFEQAVEKYEQALKTGVRLQEECGKWWADAFKQTAGPQDWQKAAASMLNEVFPAAHKNVEETLRLMEQNSRASLDLLKKATETFQSTSVADAQARVQKLWQTSLDLLQQNAQAMTQSNARLVETWTQFARKKTDGAPATAAK